MILFYNISLYCYHLLIRVLAPFNSKARFWTKGRYGIFEKLAANFNSSDEVVWFHCASLGEFEQGRPLMEKYKDQNPSTKIVLTFFSPSGYEIRKNYELADCVCYLPRDTKANAEKLLDILDPKAVFFVKYEFWAHYILEVKRRGVPLYLVSGVFRQDHIFFQWYGWFFKNLLFNFSFFFLQNKESEKLLMQAGIKNCMVTGDTRFDRVTDTAKSVITIPKMEAFKGSSSLLIAGSTWADDEKILIQYINQSENELKFVIAPHEIKEENLKRIESQLSLRAIRFSKAENEDLEHASVLIIDNIGMLSSLYQYGDVAYIGGAFGSNVHNVLEASVFGMPVLFGPNYHKFKEAGDLIHLGGAFTIDSYNSFKDRMKFLLGDPYVMKIASEVGRSFVAQSKGATEKILAYLNKAS